MLTLKDKQNVTNKLYTKVLSTLMMAILYRKNVDGVSQWLEPDVRVSEFQQDVILNFLCQDN